MSHIRHLSTSEQLYIKKAFDLGEKVHKGQKRKSGAPYFTHPVAVADMLADMGADAGTIVAALLHDTVEDTELTLDDIAKEFSPDIVALIDGVTKFQTKDLADKPTLDEKIETLRKMFTLMQKDIRIMVIKLVDRLHNMQTIEYFPPTKQKKYARETLDAYVKIADRLCMTDIAEELEGLCLAVLHTSEYKQLVEIDSENEKISKKIIRHMKDVISASALDNSFYISYERKTWKKLRIQKTAGNDPVTGISKITASITCHTIKQCYQAMGTLHQLWNREHFSFEDFINAPMMNGYRGLHTTIILEDGTRIRCKIRTKEMEEYVHRGITTCCFDSEPVGLMEYLPWTQRIDSLSKDTSDYSDQFWESLQSDILQESIVIHGPADEKILVPHNATALDAVFYLVQKDALYTENITVNGQKVLFETPLDEGVSINITLGSKKAVSRDWLNWVHSGLATAEIRKALASQPKYKRIEIGKNLLQKMLDSRQKGYLEELDEQRLTNHLNILGLDSLEEAYTAIADGHLDVKEVYDAIFEASTQENKDMMQTYVFMHQHTENKMILERMLELYQSLKGNLLNLNIRQSIQGVHTITAKIRSSKTQCDALESKLHKLGVQDVDILKRTRSGIILSAIIILLWSLNPVFARHILDGGTPLLDLVTLRLILFSFFTIGVFGIWKITQKNTYQRINNLPLLVLPSTLLHILLVILTYAAVTILIPSLHLTTLRFNVLLLPLAYFVLKNRTMQFASILITGLAIFIAASMLFFQTGQTLLAGLIYSFLALLCYTFYSLVTERTLQKHKIESRYPHFLLHMGLLLGGMGLILLFARGFSSTLSHFNLTLITYVVSCVCIPYYCYTMLLKSTPFRHFTDLSLLEVPIAIVLETLVLGLDHEYGYLFSIIVTLCMLYLLRHSRMQLLKHS